MQLSDEQRGECSYDNVTRHLLQDSVIPISLYTECIAFILGLHPLGRFARLESHTISCTENNLVLLPRGYVISPLNFIIEVMENILNDRPVFFHGRL